MKYHEFRVLYQNQPMIFAQEAASHFSSLQLMRNQFHRWQKRGLLVQVRRGIYLLNKNDRKVEIDLRFLAQVIYSPSYLSLEYALQFYGLIPESVHDLTSVSTRKTQTFQSQEGTFSYQHIQPSAFSGMRKMGSPPQEFWIAEPEKAIVDFLYLNLGRFQSHFRKVLVEDLRFQNLDTLTSEKLLKFSALFKNQKLEKVVQALAEVGREER